MTIQIWVATWRMIYLQTTKMSVIARLKPLLVPSTGKHTGTIIFLHGSGDTALGVKTWVQALNHQIDVTFPHLRIIYPTAPERPYTPMMGQVSTVWFDRKQISPYVPEDPSMDEASDMIDQLIINEVSHGIPRHRIILGGFSMGGALAMYYGLTRNSGLCGLFGLSSFMTEGSKVYQALQKKRSDYLPPVFQCHGDQDPLVHYDWGKSTSDKLQSLGVDINFHTIPDMMHEMKSPEIALLREWILQKLPEQD